MREDLLDDHGIFDAGNDPGAAAAGVTALVFVAIAATATHPSNQGPLGLAGTSSTIERAMIKSQNGTGSKRIFQLS